MMLLLSVFFACMMLVIGFVLRYFWLRRHIVLSLRATTQLEQELKQAQRGWLAGNDNDSNWRESFDKALVAFHCSELTASKTEKRIKSMCVFPISFDEVLNESVETTWQRFAKADSLLTKHFIMISAMGQGLLAVLRMNRNGMNQAALSNYAGLFTQDVHSIAKDLLTSCHSGHMLIDLQSLSRLAGEVFQGLENLYHSHPVVEGLGLLSSTSSPETLAAHFVDDNHLQVYQHAWDAFIQQFEKTLQHIDPAANHAGNMLDVMHGSIHAHFPLFTLLRSTHREILLLKDKKTSWEKSLQNAGLDFVGSGAGGFLGVKAGALTGFAFGSIFPGVGHVVGPLIGGIAGGIAGATSGRAMTNKLKKLPLEEAEREFTRSLELYEGVMKASISSTVHNLKKEARKQEMLLSQQMRPIPQCSRQLREHLAAMGERSLGEVRVYLQHKKTIIRETEKYTGNQWHLCIFNYLIPEYTHLLRSKAVVANILGQTQSFLPKEDMVSKHPAKAIKQLSLVPLPISSLRDNLRQGTSFVQETTDTYMRKVTQWSLDALTAYRVAFESLKNQVQSDFEGTRERDNKLKEEVRGAAYKVHLEMRALGLE